MAGSAIGFEDSTNEVDRNRVGLQRTQFVYQRQNASEYQTENKMIGSECWGTLGNYGKPSWVMSADVFEQIWICYDLPL